MRKLEGLVKELVEEMDFLKKREERFTRTNSSSSVLVWCLYNHCQQRRQTNVYKTLHGLPSYASPLLALGKSSIFVRTSNESILSTESAYHTQFLFGRFTMGGFVLMAKCIGKIRATHRISRISIVGTSPHDVNVYIHS